MNGLFGDFKNGAKSALNSFAQPYTRPMDIVGGLLNKAGYENGRNLPGTTNWMKEAGLLASPTPGLADDIGKYIGSAMLPMLVSGKKPNPREVAMSVAMSYLQNKLTQ